MDIYGMAWKNLEKKIAATRRQSIHKADLLKWQLEALEEAVDEMEPESLVRDRLALEDRSHAR